MHLSVWYHSNQNGLCDILSPSVLGFGICDRMNLLCCAMSQCLYFPSQKQCTDLVVQHEEQRAPHADITGSFHLEAIRLLRCGSSVPLPKGKTSMTVSLFFTDVHWGASCTIRHARIRQVQTFWRSCNLKKKTNHINLPQVISCSSLTIQLWCTSCSAVSMFYLLGKMCTIFSSFHTFCSKMCTTSLLYLCF